MKATSTSNRVTARSGGFPTAGAGDARSNPRCAGIGTILVPVDFSEPSLPACEYALDLAERFHSRVNLLHVMETSTLPDFEKFPLVRDPKAQIAKVKRELVAFAKAGSHPVVPVQAEVRAGSAWREIVAAARESKADLIVLASHGYGGFQRLLLGSVAERVVRHATCPVLVIKPGRKQRRGKPPARRQERPWLAPLT